MRIFHACFEACRLTVAIYTFALVSQAPASGEERSGAEIVPAMILKVEGDGTPKVKKNFGVEESAGAGGKVYPGDRVITDARSSVFLILNDGSVLKVGLSSEFKLENNDLNDRFVAWVFRLVKGTMRALVEKSPEPETKLRVHTPSGTIGVRGTEFVVAIDEESKTSYLYTIEGLVDYGLPGCEATKTCVGVRAGETASLQEGQKIVPKPRPFAAGELFGVNKNAEGKLITSAATDQRMTVFQETKKVTARFKQDIEDEALKALVNEASESLAAAQDRAIGRTKEMRLAMYKAIKEGTYKEILEAADSYAEAKDIFAAGTNDGAENFVAQIAAAKFRLGLAVKEAKESGAFGNVVIGKDGKLIVNWKQEKFQESKSVNYDQTANARAKRELLKGAAEEYKGVLEFTEAHPSAEKSDKKNLAANTAQVKHASTSEAKVNGVSDGRDADKRATYSGSIVRGSGNYISIVEQDRASSCKGSLCIIRAINHELAASAEGVTSAFSGARTESSRPSSFSTVSPNKGELRTHFFNKAISGNACYREEKDCKVVPCPQFQQGKKCKKGESLQNCTVKKIVVRCSEGHSGKVD